MSRRPVHLLIEDMLERIERIERFVAGLEREAFLGDEKTVDACHRDSEINTAASRGTESSACATASSTSTLTWTSIWCGPSCTPSYRR